MEIDALKQIWPEWKIEGNPLGKGSFGVVYKAIREDHNVKSFAAIKVISIPSDPSEVDSLRSEGLDVNATRTYLQGVVNDFVSEIQLMESLKGVQNIVSVEDYKVVEKAGEIGWDIYIRMELLTPFNTYICDKKLSESEVIRLGCDICTALEICSKRNIIHRDIKPENIFINDFGDFKLGDFGIARKMENLTGGLSQKGTFNYMAPEVASSGDYDARVDTYSLGIVLYRLLNANRFPFLDTQKQILNPNERRNAIDRRLRGEPLPPPCEASPAMADLILRACAYHPDDRFASATEMKQALKGVQNGTYQIADDDLNRTTSVRRAAVDYDKTTSVRKAPTASARKSSPEVNSFGSAPKKKRKLPAIITAVVAVALVVGAGFVLPKFLNSADPEETSGESVSTPTETEDAAASEKEQVAAILREAEALADKEDFEGALRKVQDGLKTYPEHKKLQEKADLYTKSANEQTRKKALEDAQALADSGDNQSAITVIKKAIEKTGEDDALTRKLDQYTQAYIDSTIESATSLKEKAEYPQALSLINTALKDYPDNSKLQQARTDIENAQKGAAPAGNSAPQAPGEYDISGGANKAGSVNVDLESIYHSSFETEGQTAWFKFSTSANYSAYSLEILNNSIDTTLYATIYDNYDNKIGERSIDKGETDHLDLALNANSEYWIQFTRYSDKCMGNFQFAVNEKICDAGLTQEQAFGIELGTPYTKAFDVHGIRDWFKFTTTNNYASYQFKLKNNNIGTKISLTVYDEYNTNLGSISVSNGESGLVDLKLAPNHEYTIELSRSNDEYNGFYQFSVSEMICDAGLSQEEAFPLNVNEAFHGTADTTFAEWYVYTFTEDRTYTLTLQNHNIDAKVYATVYDQLGTELGTINASSSSSAESSLEIAAGTVLYLKISRSYADCFGNYTICVK